MADQNRDAEAVRALALQFSFPEPGTAVVAAARITEDQELVLVRKAGTRRVGPPLCDGMGGKFGRIIGVAQIDIALVMDDVIDAIRHGPTQRIAREIMQIDLLRRLTPSATLVGEVADQFLVLGIDTDDRIACAQELLSHTTNAVNGKRVRRLMRLMGIQATYPQRKTSTPGKGHKLYPYLLRNLAITHVNQVWSADITYVPILRGFMYLVAVIDWHSRYVLAWQHSNTLDGTFCLEALRQALVMGRPEIFNTDQGAQFTADSFTDCLHAAHIQVSMDGRGRGLCQIWRVVGCARFGVEFD